MYHCIFKSKYISKRIIDYSGSIGIVTFCTKNHHQYLIKRGERFAQLVPEVVCYAKSEEVNEFTSKYNSHAGWGSTGN